MSSILLLPAEIRHMIWRLIISDHLIHLRWIYDERYSYHADLARRHDIQAIQICSDLRQKIGLNPWRHFVCQGYIPSEAVKQMHTTCCDRIKRGFAMLRFGTARNFIREREVFLLSGDSKHETLDLRFLRVCRQIHMEAIGYVYAANIFSFNDPTTCKEWMTRLSLTHRRSIRNLRFNIGDFQDWNKAFQIPQIKTLYSLRHLQLQITCGNCLKFLRNCRERTDHSSRSAWWVFSRCREVTRLSSSPLKTVDVCIADSEHHIASVSRSWEELAKQQLLQS